MDSYTLNVTPTPGGALPTVAPGDTSFELTGLTLGTSYSVSVTANKAGFTSATSDEEPLTAGDQPLTFTASVTGPELVVQAPDAFESTDVTVSWTVPTVAGLPAPVSFDVTVTGPTTVTPFTAVAGPSVTILAAQLALGDYTATVTPNYLAGSGVTGTAGSDTFSVTPNSLLYQEITVTRPPGALVLTQRCGVYGPLDAFTAADAFPGFPRTLAAAAAVASTPGVN